jgi:hypothetical protein
MLHIRILIATILLSALTVHSEENDKSDCLKHLGGGMADIACYTQLLDEIEISNSVIFKKIKKDIPSGNKNAFLLNRYMSYKNAGVKYCELISEAESEWNLKIDKSISEHRYYDVEKYACIYDLRQQQQKFLNKLSNAE